MSQLGTHHNMPQLSSTASSSSSSSSSSPSSLSSSMAAMDSFSGEGSDYGEFEVARVLANLCKRKDSDNYGGAKDGGAESAHRKYWGSKGKRSSNKRVKTESELDITRSKPSSALGSNSVPLPFDLNVDQAALCDEEECEKNGCQNVDVQVEEVCESAEPSPVGNGPHGGGRLRQNLTEAEKEARRLRRILANRESARQTIRRRQALYEELTKKAADLAAENEKLKKSKELAVKEFQSTKNANCNLKEQICQRLGLKLGENWREAAKSSDADTCSLLSANWPFLIYNSSSAPFLLPSFMQPSSDVNLSQLTNHSMAFSSKVIMPTHHVNPCLSQKQENTPNINSQNMPWCIVPCPWFLPTPNTKNNGIDQHLSLHLKDKDEAFDAVKHVSSPSSNMPSLFSQSLVQGDVKTEAHILTQPKPRNSFLEVPFGISCEKEDCISPHTPNNMRVPSATGVQTEHRKSAVKFSKKKMDANVGAEARKRRRELMKLKSIHYFPARGGFG